MTLAWRESNPALFNSCSIWGSTLTKSNMTPTTNQSPAPTLASEIQIGGDHYRSKKIQPWTAMESWMTREEFEGYLRGNVIKYIARYKDKDGIKDVYKAQHYLAKLLELLNEEDGCGR